MKVLRAGAGAVLLAASLCRAGEVPEPLFWGSDAEFLAQVDEGQFIDRLELHLLQYAADPRWRLEWAAERYSRSGFFGEFGSTTGTELYVDSQVALNLFASERVQFRYDRRDREDGRFEVSDQRFEVAWHSGRGWGVVLTGWPTFDKEYSSLGLGFRLGAARSRNALELRVVSERFTWNEKTDDDVRFKKGPVRLLADGYAETGPLRLRGSVDWGLPYEAEDGGGDAGPTRSTRGSQRSADLEAEYAGPGWAAGLRLTGIALERSEVDGAGVRSLDRAWGRAVATFRRDLGRWSVSALVGWASQRDDYSSPDGGDGAYDADALLVGLEGGWQWTAALQLRLGYLGSAGRAERFAPVESALAPRLEDAYIDKAHVRALWTFRPRMSVELLLSQAIQGGSFGGGSVKALLAF